MADTMTLEELRDSLVAFVIHDRDAPPSYSEMQGSIDAAIRERDGLRDALFLLEREVERLERDMHALEKRNG